MPEEEYIELSQEHGPTKYHPYRHVDAFFRDKITGKKIRDIAHGLPVE